VVTIPNDVNLKNSTLTLMGFQPDTTQFPLTRNVTAPYPIAYFRIGGGAFPANQPVIANGTPILNGIQGCQVQKLTGPTNSFIDPAPCGGTGGANSSTISLSQ